MHKQLIRSAIFTSILGALISLGCGGSGGHHSSDNADAPTVTATSPLSASTDAPISQQVTATFSKQMDGGTFDAASFKVAAGSTPLPGTVGYTGSTARITLTDDMPANTEITVTVTTAVKDTEGHALAADYVWSFTTGASGDSIAPTVSSTDPADAETGVGLNKAVTVVFSEPMAAQSINETTFTVTGTDGGVQGTVTLLSNTATFTPNGDWNANSAYTATVTTGATDLSGNGLAVNKVWTFNTGVNTDMTPPTVTLTDPADNETAVPINKAISATFSEVMDVSTITTTSFTVAKPLQPAVAATISYVNNVATLTPTTELDPTTVYQATITTEVKDAAGNAMATTKTWSFTTGVQPDNTPPTVVSTNPADESTNAFLNRSVNATFSEAMQSDTITTSTFTVDGVSGTVSYDSLNNIATFQPSADLAMNTTYTAHISTGVTDSAGNALQVMKTWTFTTGVQRAQTTLDLGSAVSYAVIAGSTVTNTGPTIINGDLGVSPGSAITGFPPGIVNGVIHANDSQAAQAKSDLLAAQIDAATRLGGQLLPTDVSGMTFTPGLYRNNTSLTLLTGAVTLDAQGDPNAVFIFQTGTTLNTSSGTFVILTNGAQAKNVYWSIGSSATLGTGSVFQGNILADVSITATTGATITGTLLTKNGAVTLDTNTVTNPN